MTLPGKFVSCRRLRCASFIYSTGVLTENSQDACCLKTAQPANDDFIHGRSSTNTSWPGVEKEQTAALPMMLQKFGTSLDLKAKQRKKKKFE